MMTARNSNDLAQALGKDSVDVVIDLVAGPPWPSPRDVRKPFGRYAVAGAIGGPMVKLDVRTLYRKDPSPFGCTALDETVFSNRVRRIETGDIKPLVARTFALDQITAVTWAGEFEPPPLGPAAGMPCTGCPAEGGAWCGRDGPRCLR